jgi:hypothetical protein
MKRVDAKTEEILGIVGKQQFARAFCDNLVEHLAMAYVNNIVQCRPISEVGAQQVRFPPLVDEDTLTAGIMGHLTLA